MMYLIIRICQNSDHLSCGCGSDSNYGRQKTTDFHPHGYSYNMASKDHMVKTVNHELKQINLSALDDGLTHRLTKLISNNHRGKLKSTASLIKLILLHDANSVINIMRDLECSPNFEFASALTAILLDGDDTKVLNKASKLLNQRNPFKKMRHRYSKRLVHTDQKELSSIRWAKSAVNIHNNYIGRKVSQHVETLVMRISSIIH